MIRLNQPEALSPLERYGVAVLLDLSRLLVVTDAHAEVVTLSVMDGDDASHDLATLEAKGWGLQTRAGVVAVPRHLLALVCDLVGAAVEQRSVMRDGYDRVPVEENPLVKAGQWERPIVHAIAAGVRTAVREAAGRRPIRTVIPWPGGRAWAAAFTHDVDIVAGWPAFALMRVAELLRKGEVTRAGAVIVSAVAHVGRDPVRRAVDEVLLVEREAGIRSTWFFLAGTPSLATWRRGDVTYDIDSRAAQGILRAVREADGEVALHGSFDAFTDPEPFARERGRLEASGCRVRGARQHFLRMRPGRTHAAMAAAGLHYDASYGYSDRNGFRLGVADVVPAWNEHEGRPEALEVVPLGWMDRVLSKHEGKEAPAALVASATESADRCKAVGGLWVGLWHPNMTAPLGFPGAADAYRRIVERVQQADPYVAPLTEIVEWCRARRALRARRVGPDGSVELDPPGVGDHRFALRDEDGRAA